VISSHDLAVFYFVDAHTTCDAGRHSVAQRL